MSDLPRDKVISVISTDNVYSELVEKGVMILDKKIINGATATLVKDKDGAYSVIVDVGTNGEFFKINVSK